MFTAFLQDHPMQALMRDGTRILYPSAADRPAWEGISAEYRQEIQGLAAAYAKVPYPFRNASGFLAFARTGDRQADEQPYFMRRRKLCAAVLNVRIINDVDAAAIRVELREQSVLARFFGIAWETIRDLAADDLRL